MAAGFPQRECSEREQGEVHRFMTWLLHGHFYHILSPVMLKGRGVSRLYFFFKEGVLKNLWAYFKTTGPLLYVLTQSGLQEECKERKRWCRGKNNLFDIKDLA